MEGERGEGFLYSLQGLGVPFPIPQARTRGLLLELSLSIPWSPLLCFGLS